MRMQARANQAVHKAARTVTIYNEVVQGEARPKPFETFDIAVPVADDACKESVFKVEVRL